MSLYEKVVEFVDEAFKGKKPHFERTVFWLKTFLPTYTEAHEIAAYAHDIERGVMGEKDRDYLNPEILKRHQEEGAKIVEEFLFAQGADQMLIEKVKHLINRHEVGGDEEQNTLMDADSVSFFETNAEMFVLNRVKEDGYVQIREKLDWMFNRISTEERKVFARENYEKWSAELEKLKK
ncbi:MAG: DUF4202 family protein [Candidatus Taylorbacteria bacterium]|nr:DUF4202 family protein [Candidatus Taylorbacteria bacterium]